MQIPNVFSEELNPSYYIRKPARKQLLDETIYYKRNEPFERPVEILTRPVVRDTIFLPEREPPPVVPVREVLRVSPEPRKVVYTTTTTTTPVSRFSLLPALSLNADCPCWAWICIVLGFVVLLALLGLLLYFILHREDLI